MSKKTGAVVLASLVVAALLLSGWLVIGRGFSAKEEPTMVEAFVARRLRGLATPRDAREMVNPVALSDDVLAEAMTHFADHCATCHANDGSGDTSIGKGLYPKPPDMRQLTTQNLTDGELFYIIHNGIRMTGMPAFGGDTPPAQDFDSWKLVHFIRHLPRITADELEQMKSMNPKGKHEMEEEEAIQRFLRGEDVEVPGSSHTPN
jgi:mono/diheme cytochrome c family protein